LRSRGIFNCADKRRSSDYEDFSDRETLKNNEGFEIVVMSSRLFQLVLVFLGFFLATVGAIAAAEEPVRMRPVSRLTQLDQENASEVPGRLPDSASEGNSSDDESLATMQSPLQASQFDDLKKRLDAAEKRINELDRSDSETDDADADSEPTLFKGEFKDQLDKLWEAHQGKKKSARPTATVFGRLHLEALSFPGASPGIDNFENPTTGAPVGDRIQFRRIRLGTQGKILDTGIYRVEFDFGNPSRSTFRDAYVGFEDLPFLQTLLIGNQKRPLGLDAWSSNQHVVFFERPLAINAFNPNFRRIGIQSYGHSDDDNLNWQVGAFELQDVKGIGRDVGDPLHFSFNTRVSGTPWYDEASNGSGYLHLGVSNMFASTASSFSASGNDGDLAGFNVRPELQTTSPWIDTGTILGATHFNVTGLEAVLNVGSLQLQGEYLTTFVNRQSAANLNFQGGYVQAAWFLTGEHTPWDREAGRVARLTPLETFFMVRTKDDRIGSGLGAWQLAARWSYLSLSDKDIRGGRQEDVTLGLNWYWTAHSKMMFNMVHGQIEDRAPVNGYSSGNFTGLGVRFLMDF